jgi:hypothetical protein
VIGIGGLLKCHLLELNMLGLSYVAKLQLAESFLNISMHSRSDALETVSDAILPELVVDPQSDDLDIFVADDDDDEDED